MKKSKDLPQTSGRPNPSPLKSGMADTGSVVHQVKGHVKFGRYAGGSGNSGRNNMVSANAGRKR